MFQILFSHQLRRGLQHGLPRIPGRPSDVRNQVRELRIHRFSGIKILLENHVVSRNLNSPKVLKSSNRYLNKQEELRINRDRSFDRITFFQNLSVVLSKFVSKEKNRSCKYRHVLYVLSNSVLLKIFGFSKEWYSNKKMLI